MGEAAPTAASVSVSGRVMANGRGVSKARVVLISTNGETRTTITNPLGYYSFTEIAAGETYVFSVSHKQHSFAPQILTIVEETTDLNFIAGQDKFLNPVKED